MKNDKILIYHQGSHNWTAGLIFYKTMLSLLRDENIDFSIYNPKEFINTNDHKYFKGLIKNYYTNPLSKLGELLLKERFNVLFGIPNISSFPGISLIHWITDMQHLHFPKNFSNLEIDARYTYFRNIAKNSTLIIVNSNMVKEDFERYYPLYKDKVRILKYVSNPSDEIYDINPQKILKKYSLPEKFFYLPNQFWKHKNHLTVFKTINELKKIGINIRLILTGNPNDYRSAEYFKSLNSYIIKNNLSKNIIYLGFIPHEDVYNLIRQSVAVLNPSLFEGCGISLYESKAFGKRMIVSDIPVIRENAPKNVSFFNPNSKSELYEILKIYWEDNKYGLDSLIEKKAREYNKVDIKNYRNNLKNIINESKEINSYNDKNKLFININFDFKGIPLSENSYLQNIFNNELKKNNYKYISLVKNTLSQRVCEDYFVFPILRTELKEAYDILMLFFKYFSFLKYTDEILIFINITDISILPVLSYIINFNRLKLNAIVNISLESIGEHLFKNDKETDINFKIIIKKVNKYNINKRIKLITSNKKLYKYITELEINVNYCEFFPVIQKRRINKISSNFIYSVVDYDLSGYKFFYRVIQKLLKHDDIFTINIFHHTNTTNPEFKLYIQKFQQIIDKRLIQFKGFEYNSQYINQMDQAKFIIITADPDFIKLRLKWMILDAIINNKILIIPEGEYDFLKNSKNIFYYKKKISSSLINIIKKAINEENIIIDSNNYNILNFLKLFSKIKSENLIESNSKYEEKINHYISSYNEDIIVYQMGKVGSTTICRSLQAYGLKNIYHVHSFNKSVLNKIKKRTEKREGKTPVHVQEAIVAYEKIIKKNKKVKIISIAREPISRNISSYFENYKGIFSEDLNDYKIQDMNQFISELTNRFIKKYSHSLSLSWFDYQFKTYLNIDIYKYIFPKEKGYLIFKDRNYEILIFKLELKNNIIEKVISEFLQIEDFTLINANIGEKKKYNYIYKEFKNKVSLPKEYIDKMYNSKYMNFFYTENEIESFRKKWIR